MREKLIKNIFKSEKKKNNQEVEEDLLKDYEEISEDQWPPYLVDLNKFAHNLEYSQKDLDKIAEGLSNKITNLNYKKGHIILPKGLNECTKYSILYFKHELGNLALLLPTEEYPKEKSSPIKVFQKIKVQNDSLKENAWNQLKSWIFGAFYSWFEEKYRGEMISHQKQYKHKPDK